MLALRALATTLEHGLPGLERSPAAERACVEAVLGAPTPMELPAAPLRFWTPNGFALRAAAAMLLAALFGLAFASRSSEPEIANERSRSVDRGRGFERGSAPARVELKGEPTLLRPTPAAPTPQAVRVAPEPVAVPSAPVAAPALTPRPVTPEPVGRPVELAREPAPVERRVEPSREAPEQERMVALAMRMGLKASDVEVVRHRALLEGIDRLREAEVVRSMDLLTVLDLEDFE